MAGKGRKAAQQVEEEDLDKSESGSVREMMKMLLEGNERAEARRIADARAVEASRLAEIEVLRVNKIAEEERAELMEDRAEARRVAEVIAAEERAEEKRRRKLTEEEEAGRAKEWAAQIASGRLLEQQAEFAAKQFEQQKALLQIQAELGEKAAQAHREDQSIIRRRERAVSSVPNYREGDDVEEFLLTAERRLKAGGIPEEEWLTTIGSKLGGKMGNAWQDLCVVVEDYQEVKSRMLKVCGYTAKLAGEVFYGFKREQVKGMTADQLYHRGVQLFRRMVAPIKASEALEFAILRAWVCSIIPKQARAVLDVRAVATAAELVDALQDFLMVEGDRTEGQAAVFRKQACKEENSEKKVFGASCFTCGKLGHKAIDCWQSKGGATSLVDPSSSSKVIKCFTCGEEGHKSPQCPKIKIEKGTAEAKPLKGTMG